MRSVPSSLPKEKILSCKASFDVSRFPKKAAANMHILSWLIAQYSFTAVYNVIICLISFREMLERYTGGIWGESHAINLSAPIQVQNTEESVLQTF